MDHLDRYQAKLRGVITSINFDSKECWNCWIKMLLEL
jgi:hypothetical protein